jgi:hypothetical protein
MRRILALFDAPVPALAALRALAKADVDPADVGCVPALAAAEGLAQAPLATATDLSALRQALAARDMPAGLLEVAVEMVRRGGILLLVETPNRSAELVAQLLDAAGALDPDTLVAAWQTQPGLTYDWAAVPAPLLDAPAPPEGMRPASPSATPPPEAEPPAEPPANPDPPPL